ncbi:MAG: hypothetical protein WEA09_05245 [Gemmatimonadota bacterium]
MSDEAGASLRWGRARRASTELLVIFVGVTAAFFVEDLRETLGEREQLRQVTRGLVAEMYHYEDRGTAHADSIAQRLARWQAADASGEQAVPAFYRLPGAPSPPTAAWDAAVSSGVASMFEPALRIELGYFYNEYVGIHSNYVRHLSFVELEILPRVGLGASAFYGEEGKLGPEFGAQMALLEEFGRDLGRLSAEAGDLGVRLEELLASW